MCNNLRIYVNPKNDLFYINNDDAINCRMQIPNTYSKFVFTQFNKKRDNSNLQIQFEYIYIYIYI